LRDRLLWFGCLAYAILFTWLGAIKYGVHRNLVDFGIFAQTSASAFGCFCNPIEGSHWTFHFSPILYVVGSAVALVRSPLTLVALQAIAGALVAPPIYGIVRRTHDDVRIARLAALIVWLYPALAGLIFGDFHENGFAPAAVAWTLYAFDAGAIAGTIAGAVVTLAIKEDQAVFLAIAGAIGAWRFRGTPRGRVASGVALGSVLLFAVYVTLVHPHAATRFYSWSGGDVATIVGGLGSRLGFFLLAFGPLLFLPFSSPAIVLAIAPLSEVLLSRMSTTYTMGTHYAGAWIGYVLVAFAFAVRKMPPARARIALIACAALCVLELLVADPLHPGLNLRRTEARDTALDRFLQKLPPDADVATQEEAYTHLALTDPNARLLPETSNQTVDACLVLLDQDFPNSARLEEYWNAFMQLVDRGRYALATNRGNILLYRRSHGCN
jgi:uncharacterized membrane protein